MQRILLVEDSQDIHILVGKALGESCRLKTVNDLCEARGAVEKESPDLILLDAQLPDGSGFEFCAWLKNQPKLENVPVIFLTGKSEAMDKVLAFSIGADDYVVKPFDPFELKARVQARLRKKKEGNTDLLTKGRLKFDRIMQRAWVMEDEGERDLRLTPFEFRLLYFLASRELEIFDRNKLLRHLLDTNVHICEETIYTHISALRRKLGKHKTYVECIPRVGYRFNLVSPQ